jgi:hypothetical protein
MFALHTCSLIILCVTRVCSYVPTEEQHITLQSEDFRLFNASQIIFNRVGDVAATVAYLHIKITLPLREYAGRISGVEHIIEGYHDDVVAFMAQNPKSMVASSYLSVLEDSTDTFFDLKDVFLSLLASIPPGPPGFNTYVSNHTRFTFAQQIADNYAGASKTLGLRYLVPKTDRLGLN